MAMSSSMRRRSGLTTAEACSWDIEGTSRDEGGPSCSEPHPTPSSSHRLHQLYSTPPQALPRSGFVHGRDPDMRAVRGELFASQPSRTLRSIAHKRTDTVGEVLRP